MSNKIKNPKKLDYCNKCNKNVVKRLVNSSTNNYYVCSLCSKINSERYRDKFRLRYLAQKANYRDKKGSDVVTEKMLKKIYDKQDGKCALTGMVFSKDNSFYKISIDRIDSNKPYIKSNIQLVLYIVNKMKSELDQNEFINICKYISKHSKIKK